MLEVGIRKNTKLMAAKKKIGRAAAFYDREKNSMKGFDSRALNPTEFRSQLRANFLIELTNTELGAIIMLFDKDGDGTVDTVEFMNEFFKLGKAERMKAEMKRKDKEEMLQRHRAKIQAQKDKKVQALVRTKTTDKFTEADETSAIQKVSAVALTYDSSKPTLKEFNECSYLTAVEFQQLMQRNFLVHLTASEVAALMHMFDANHKGLIDTRLFTYHFFRLGRAERDKHDILHAKVTHQKHVADEKRREGIKEKYGKLILARMAPATDADRESAERKIRLAATCFTRDKAFAVSIEKCFEARDLTPTDFRAILKNNFDVTLSPGELTAVMDMFDSNKDGSISCVEFLTQFFLMGGAERKHILELHRREDERRAREREERIRKKIEAAEKLTQTKVVWPVLPPADSPVDQAMDTADDDFFSLTKVETRGKSAPTSLGSPANGNESPTNLPSLNRSRLRKPSVIDLVSPNKMALKLIQQRDSLANLFPKASQETKEFIKQIEEKEAEIKRLKPRRKKKNRNKSKFKEELHNALSSGAAAEEDELPPPRTALPFSSSSSFRAPWKESEEHTTDGQVEDSLADPNTWGAGGRYPDEINAFADDDNQPVAVPFGFLAQDRLTSAAQGDRCDSRGGTRGGASRIPTMTYTHGKTKEEETGDMDEFYGSEFESTDHET